tara:strand:- start:65 stop:616 length:552 start_codon:yes stop_codon:yes gene_type:complete
MYIACEKNNVELMQWLFDHGAQNDVRTPRNDGNTPMFLACEHKQINIVQFLHKHGAAKDINVPSWNQETPLWRACKDNSLDIVQWLILQGTPSKTTVASWFNQLNYTNRMILFQQGLLNRDVDHESFVTCLSAAHTSTPLIAVHLLDIDLVLEKIGEYLRGSAETRSLWYHIVQQGPGDEEDI